MTRTKEDVGRLVLRLAGVMLIAAAWWLVHPLLADAAGHRSDEPGIVYLLALAVFWSASAGCALACLGPRLMERVIVAERWSPHVPEAFRD